MEESGKKSFRKAGLRYGATLDKISDARSLENQFQEVRERRKKKVKRKK